VADGLADADSLAEYDVVLLDPETLSSLWRPHAQLEADGVWRIHQGRDGGLVRAIERLLSARRVELEALLRRVGGSVVVRASAPGPPVELVFARGGNRQVDARSVLPPIDLSREGQYMALPKGIRLLSRRGTTLVDVDDTHPLAEYMRRYSEYGFEAVIVSTFGVPLESFGRVLARDRVGDAVAWEVAVGAGRLLFVPSFPGADPREMGEALKPVLGALCECPVAASGPDWLARYLLPDEEELDARARELADARAELLRQEEELAVSRAEYESLRGLLYPRGARELVQGMTKALQRLGFTCTPRADIPRTVEARSDEGTLLVRAAYAPVGQVEADEHRALLLAVDRVHTEERRTVHGVLVGAAHPEVEPTRRPAQWSDAVRRGCVEHDMALLAAPTLYQVVAGAADEGERTKLRRSLVEAVGEWRGKA